MFTFREPSNNLLEPRHVSNFLSKEEIQTIFNNLKTISFEQGQTDSNEKYNLRSSQVKWIPFSKEWEWLYGKLYFLISQVNNDFFKLNLNDINENIQYTEYSYEYKGEYGWHTDVGTQYPPSHRKISVTIQISDPSEYEGGHLQLFSSKYNENAEQEGIPPFLQNSPKALGTATIFPSFIPHRVTPIVKGIRKSLVLWVGGTPFR